MKSSKLIGVNYYQIIQEYGNSKFTLCLIVFWAAFMSFTTVYYGMKSIHCPQVWHGGTPALKGSCWCGHDGYCMCTPNLAIEVIMEVRHNNEIKIVLIKRRDPPLGWAIPGGFVNIGESCEQAATREIAEETSVSLNVNQLEQFRFYSDPSRDTRRHTASAIFRYVFTNPSDITSIKNGDDAKQVVLVPLKDVLKLDLRFDHPKVMKDYIERYHSNLLTSLVPTS